MGLDRIGITEGIDAYILVDDIGNTGFPVSKMIIGTEGVNEGFVDTNNPVPMYLAQSRNAFNDAVVTQQTEQVNLNFTYEINPEKVYDFTFGQATNSIESGKLLISAGPTSNSIGAVVSRRTINYRPGLGACARFTAGFTTGVSGVGAGSSAGIGTEENALLFNYKDNTMNIIHRRHGQRDSRLLDFSNGSDTSGNIVVTLNDNLITGVVTNNSSLNADTATEFTSGLNPISLLIAGYQAFNYGNYVEFIALRTGPKTGVFDVDFGVTNATGTLTQTATGVVAIETTIPQSTWNHDVADGTQFLPNVDWSKGNVFQIKYQWLGFGLMEFFVEHPDKGTFVRVHDIHHAGSSDIPSLGNPNLPIIYVAGNGSTSDTVEIFGSSAAGFLEGGTKLTNHINKKSAAATKTIGTTAEPLLAFYMPQMYKGRSNESFAEVLRLVLTSSAAGEFQIYKGTDFDPVYLEGTTNWVAVTNNTMLLTTDCSDFTGGTLQSIYRCDGVLNIAATESEVEVFDVLPGELIVISASADQGSVKFGMTLTWAENK
jgi:hypothetical protein